MDSGPTPHLEGKRGDYAPITLVPGDPKRARFIAENYLQDVRQVNSVRGADGFTGTFNGIPISVQAVGMGVPSAAIYYTELIRFYGVQTLIRVGSCGGLSESVGLGDIICATGAGTDSAAIQTLNNGLSLPAVPSWDLLSSAMSVADATELANRNYDRQVVREIMSVLDDHNARNKQLGIDDVTAGNNAIELLLSLIHI